VNPPRNASIAGGALLLVALAACASDGQAEAEVVLDGLFDEWATAATVIDDPADAQDAAVDILSVQALDDEDWLYLAIDVGNQVTLQSLPGTLHLLLDIDGDRSTGSTLEEMTGVDLVVDLSASDDPEARGSGFALRAIDDAGESREVERYALGLMAAPTWSAPRFELRLTRLGGDGVAPLGGSIRIKAVYEELGLTRDDTAVGSYVFASRPSAAPSHPRLVIPPKSDGAVRVAQWNVAVDRFASGPAGFAAVLAEGAPDVVLLDELPGNVTAEELTEFFDQEPLRRLGSWSFVLGETGGVQRAAVAARDREVRPAAALAAVPYPDAAVAMLVDMSIRAPAGQPRRYFESEAGRGVSAAGAWVDVGGRPTLFVVVDLQSGGWDGSPQDQLRTLQGSVVRARVLAELGESTAPLVIGGDFNLVGSRQPLFQLSRGLDVDGSDLVPADARRLGERTYATWRNPRDRFTPGRLDFILVSDAALTTTGAFVLAPEDLDDAALERLGLDRSGIYRSLSDHVPLFADVRLP
jgi:endonuclease/exonuclease/phosphatase family metal-dependent hydrolase